MTKRALVMMAVGLCLTVGVARADEHPQMQEAKKNLEAARTALQAADHDYGGHRTKAVENINQALRNIDEGLQVVAQKEKQVEHKEQKAEQKGGTTGQEKTDELKTKLKEMETH